MWVYMTTSKPLSNLHREAWLLKMRHAGALARQMDTGSRRHEKPEQAHVERAAWSNHVLSGELLVEQHRERIHGMTSKELTNKSKVQLLKDELKANFSSHLTTKTSMQRYKN